MALLARRTQSFNYLTINCYSRVREQKPQFVRGFVADARVAEAEKSQSKKAIEARNRLVIDRHIAQIKLFDRWENG